MRHINSIIIIAIGIILMLANGCRDKVNCHDSVLIKNNSDKPIYYEDSPRYPDTIPINGGTISDPVTYKIGNFSSKFAHHRNCIEDDFDFTSKIMIFIYDAETLETTPWDTVVKNYMILKRYDLTLHDLDSLNWTITYP